MSDARWWKCHSCPSTAIYTLPFHTFLQVTSAYTRLHLPPRLSKKKEEKTNNVWLHNLKVPRCRFFPTQGAFWFHSAELHTQTHTHTASCVVPGHKKWHTTGALGAALGMLNVQVTARSLTVNGTHKMAKVTAGDSGAVTHATLKRDVTRAASTGTVASSDERTLKVSLQRLSDRACNIVRRGGGKKKKKKEKHAPPLLAIDSVSPCCASRLYAEE